MKTITVAHQKGGVGKTTIALNLAYCFADSAKVAITDTDLQGSIYSLGNLVQGVDLVSPDEVLAGKVSGYDVLIVDTPPYLSTRLSDLFALSDFVLIPTKAGLLDVLAIRSTIDLLQKAMAKRPDLKAGIVLNMVMPRYSMTGEVTDALAEYAEGEHGIGVLSTLIHQRISYVRSPQTAGVFNSTDERAKDEIQQVAISIINQLQ